MQRKFLVRSLSWGLTMKNSLRGWDREPSPSVRIKVVMVGIPEKTHPAHRGWASVWSNSLVQSHTWVILEIVVPRDYSVIKWTFPMCHEENPNSFPRFVQCPYMEARLINVRGTRSSSKCEQEWNISAADQREWNQFFPMVRNSYQTCCLVGCETAPCLSMRIDILIVPSDTIWWWLVLYLFWPSK